MEVNELKHFITKIRKLQVTITKLTQKVEQFRLIFSQREIQSILL